MKLARHLLVVGDVLKVRDKWSFFIIGLLVQGMIVILLYFLGKALIIPSSLDVW